MPGSMSDLIAILFITVIPAVFVLLQIFFSWKKKLILSFILPVLWTALGIWMVSTIYYMGEGFSSELVIFFVCGNLILIGITVIVRNIKKKRLKNK
ncbi:MAG: hypothetical protein K0S76_2520 [Herbinix sp.]|jgi:hypothetical protein|nr:hypothetical protein [Herbinix sp.]